MNTPSSKRPILFTMRFSLAEQAQLKAVADAHAPAAQDHRVRGGAGNMTAALRSLIQRAYNALPDATLRAESTVGEIERLEKSETIQKRTAPAPRLAPAERNPKPGPTLTKFRRRVLENLAEGRWWGHGGASRRGVQDMAIAGLVERDAMRNYVNYVITSAGRAALGHTSKAKEAAKKKPLTGRDLIMKSIAKAERKARTKRARVSKAATPARKRRAATRPRGAAVARRKAPQKPRKKLHARGRKR